MPKSRSSKSAAPKKRKYSMKFAGELSAASKRRTPGHPKGGEQDRLSKRLYAAAAARGMIGAARQKEKAVRARIKKAVQAEKAKKK